MRGPNGPGADDRFTWRAGGSTGLDGERRRKAQKAETMGRTLIIIGLVIVAIGVLWPFLSKLGIGRLPGDIRIVRDGFAFYFPITTMILVSIVLTLIFRLFGK